MISQFFLISPRGDSILYKDYRGDLARSTGDVFLRNVKRYQGKQQSAPPIFNVEGVNYFYTKMNGLYFVLTCVKNVPPSLVMEFLTRATRVFKDYCGVISEETIRSNFVLLYELLDEIMDNGYIQGTSSEVLKRYVFNEPIVVETKKNKGSKFQLPKFNPKTTSSDATNKPITLRDPKQGGRDEIFVDIFERVSFTFAADGQALTAAIDGTIQMKNYLSGNPTLRIALNEDLTIGASRSGAANYGVVEIDDCNFHECARLDEFDSQRIVSFLPPDGEFVLMNYRITSPENFQTPFRIFPFFELASPKRGELVVKIRADIPPKKSGTNIVVQFPVPKSTASVSTALGRGSTGQSAEYDAKRRVVTWKIRKLPGGTESILRAKITLLKDHSSNVRKEIGPINMAFEVPLYTPSNLQVKYLRIQKQTVLPNEPAPFRWVRYVCKSQSYVCRL